MDHSTKNRLLICFHFLLGGIWQCSFVYEAGVSDWVSVCVMPHFTHDPCSYHTFSSWDLHWEREKVRIKGTSQRGRSKHLEYKSWVGVQHARNTNNTIDPLTGDCCATSRHTFPCRASARRWAHCISRAGGRIMTQLRQRSMPFTAMPFREWLHA